MRKSQLNITFLLRYWPVYGGGETVTRILANKLVERGHTVSVVYLWEKRQDNMPFIDGRIAEYKIEGVPVSGEDGIRKHSYKKIQGFLTSFFTDNHTDIIINQWFPNKEVYKAKQNTGAKLICCHHTNVIPNHLVLTPKHKLFYFVFGKYGVKLRRLLIKHRLSRAFKYSDLWVFLSECFADDAGKLFNDNINDRPDKIRVIHNPLTFTYFLPPDEIENKQKEIIYVGRIDDNKRVRFIIEAWSRLEKKEALNEWRLTIIGSGADFENTRNYADALMCKRVAFEGQQIPVSYYKRASIFAFTSCNEGWAVVLLEAQQYGCVPVAMDSYPSLHEIIQDGVNGVIVRNDDIPGFADALDRIMLDGEYRRRLAIAGLETCRRFSIDNVIREWEALFKE